MKRGEIRRVRNWDYAGHEATGNRPCLIISPDWFNSNGNVIIAPLTTPGPNHEHWWEVHIGSTDSTCLVPDARTVPTTALGPSVLGTATDYELEDAMFALYRLTGGSEDAPHTPTATAGKSGPPTSRPCHQIPIQSWLSCSYCTITQPTSWR